MNFFSVIIEKILALFSGKRVKNVGEAENTTPFAKCFQESSAEDDESEEESAEFADNSVDKGGRNLVLSGSFVKALRTAQAQGKPLLVIVAGSASSDDAMWAAATDPSTVSLLSEGASVLWGAWAGSQELEKAARTVRGVDWSSSNTAVLLRPSQQPATLSGAVAPRSSTLPSVLGTFPPFLAGKKKSGGRQGKGKRGAGPGSSSSSGSPLVTATRLRSWVASTLERYSPELAEDAKAAADRAIVSEISQGLKSGLAEDLAREEREARQKAEALKAEAEAAKAKAEAAAAAAKEKARRATLREALGPEPPPPPPQRKGGRGNGDALGGSKKGNKEEEEEDAAVATVAVRLPDGSRQRRRFWAHKHTAGSVLDWLDAEFGLASDSLRLGDAAAAATAASSKGRGASSSSSSSSALFKCSGRKDPIAEKTLASLGFAERPVLLAAELGATGAAEEAAEALE